MQASGPCRWLARPRSAIRTRERRDGAEAHRARRSRHDAGHDVRVRRVCCTPGCHRSRPSRATCATSAMLITTPVLLYSGAPFLHRALGSDLRGVRWAWMCRSRWRCDSRSPRASFNTCAAQGQTYFDSVTMFIFFLSAGRYVEMVVRQRSLSMSEAVGTKSSGACARVTGRTARPSALPIGADRCRRSPAEHPEGRP